MRIGFVENGGGRGGDGREDVVGDRRGRGRGGGEEEERMERGGGCAAVDTDKVEDANLQIKCLTRFK